MHVSCVSNGWPEFGKRQWTVAQAIGLASKLPKLLVQSIQKPQCRLEHASAAAVVVPSVQVDTRVTGEHGNSLKGYNAIALDIAIVVPDVP